MEESFLWTLAEAEAERRWGTAEELLAVVAELIHEQTRVLVRMLGGKGSRVPDRLRIPRPGEEAHTVPTMSMGQMARMLTRR